MKSSEKWSVKNGMRKKYDRSIFDDRDHIWNRAQIYGSKLTLTRSSVFKDFIRPDGLHNINWHGFLLFQIEIEQHVKWNDYYYYLHIEIKSRAVLMRFICIWCYQCWNLKCWQRWKMFSLFEKLWLCEFL